MYISGTFLNSKIARRIALVIFLASFIPTLLVTELAHQTIKSISKNNSQAKLVDASKTYALLTFSYLINARNTLKEIEHDLSVNPAKRFSLNGYHKSTFQSLKLLDSDGIVVAESGISSYSSIEMQNLLRAQKYSHVDAIPSMLVIPAIEKFTFTTVVLVLVTKNSENHTQVLVAELNPNYLWGNQEDYPSDIRVCVRRINKPSETLLFCSINKDLIQSNNGTPDEIGSWELFLGGEFKDSSWKFETSRIYPLDQTSSYSFVGGYSYMAVAGTSLLLVGLLSSMQIRRTMVPLETLIQATRNITKGKFQLVEVKKSNEFGELAGAFNSMSGQIERQFQTLQGLALIDHEIISNLDVDQIIKKIIARIEQILPAEVVCISKVAEKNSVEARCNAIISSCKIITSSRLTISIEELNDLKTINHGHFGDSDIAGPFSFINFLIILGAKSYWILPILWQGEICAFISIGSKQILDKNAPYWSDIAELANRVGIAISAQEREAKLLVQAQYDSLTGLPNRILLNDRIHQAIEFSNRSGNPFWLAFMDIDKFKFINDSFGHHVGDQFLCEISKRLEQTVRGVDTVARFGGDEFIILLQSYSNESSKNEVLRRLMQSVSAAVNIDGNEIITSCSIGITSYPTDGHTPETLLTNADIALYSAKELGRNNFQEFNPVMNEKATFRLKIETHLRKAIELDEFAVFYQPKIELKSNKIVGMEALIRWNNKSLGLIPPQHFIPIAEESGLILSIGEWVLKTACKQAVAWQKAGYGNLLMSVNLSARQLAHVGLIDLIKSTLKETGLSGNNLELELTESMIMEDTEETISVLKNIKSLGILLSIDDFGTGFSSLSYLKKLPVDTLKIDKIFVDEITSQASDAPIVASIIALAKNLKLKVVAEGVESEEQVSYLHSHGCDEIQGYFYSRPESATLIENKLKVNNLIHRQNT